ncbi:MAG: serine/threonine-protein kinase [Gemmatimonadota bacterium]|nr:serine/threonine-protein kinase [Gemmatimonadota bacterium]
MSPTTQSDLVGHVVGGRYRVVAKLGEGGMGQVYLAEHVRMKRKSAIKIMRPALVGDAEALQRFTREAENASKISHPNVASIFDFGETDDGLVYLAMEFVDGEALSATLKREVAMHPVVAADIVGQAANALQAAHELGILHRDFKPDNLMLSKRTDGTFVVKLVDFGIARTMERGTQQVTRTGFAVGTPEFMSPEQLAGDVLDGRSDQYSLALVAFITLTGHDAFANSTSKESLIARLTSRPRRLDEVRSDLDWPSSLQQVFDRALAPDPVDRFETVAEFGLTLGSAVMEMTPTQTAEIYRHALGQRMVSVASLTPNDMRRVGTPAAGMATSKLQASAPPPKRRADPVGVRRRPSVMPYVLLLGIATWGTWWYGAQQPAGTARAASDAIAHYAGAARALVRGVIDRTPASAAAPATTPPPPARRATTKRRTNATPSVADTSAPPPPDTNQASADSLIPQ